MGGGMEAHKNVFIEDCRIPREILKHNLSWTRQNFGIVGFFGIVIPLLVHKGTVREFTIAEDAGRPYQEFF